MNSVLEKTNDLMKQSFSSKDVKTFISGIIDSVCNEERLEGLTVLRRENEWIVFETGAKRPCGFAGLQPLVPGQAGISFGGDCIASIVLAFLVAAKDNRMPPQVVFSVLEQMIWAFGKAEGLSNKESAR